MNTVGNMIMDRLMAKQSELKASVNLAWLAGFSSCGENTAKVIVASASPITVQDAVAVVATTTNNGLRAFVPSFTTIKSSSPNTHLAAIHVYKPRFSLREASQEVVAGLHAISATSYMDTQLNTIWERKLVDGAEYLVRANEDNPLEVLTTALLASTSVQERVEGEAFNMYANAGDFVMFFATSVPKDDNQEFIPFLEVAEVIANNNNESYTIDLKDNGFSTQATIPASAVVQTIEASAEDVALGKVLTRGEVIDFLKKCYPASYGPALDSISNSDRL